MMRSKCPHGSSASKAFPYRNQFHQESGTTGNLGGNGPPSPSCATSSTESMGSAFSTWVSLHSVVARASLSGHNVVWAELHSKHFCAETVHDSRLEVHESRAGYVGLHAVIDCCSEHEHQAQTESTTLLAGRKTQQLVLVAPQGHRSRLINWSRGHACCECQELTYS